MTCQLESKREFIINLKILEPRFCLFVIVVVYVKRCMNRIY